MGEPEKERAGSARVFWIIFQQFKIRGTEGVFQFLNCDSVVLTFGFCMVG